MSSDAAGPDRQSAREIARRRALFREVNERIDALAEGFDLRDAVQILCECGIAHCRERVVLTQAEYESIRRVPTRFAVLPGHDLSDVERVVQQNERFVVVERVAARRRAR